MTIFRNVSSTGGPKLWELKTAVLDSPAESTQSGAKQKRAFQDGLWSSIIVAVALIPQQQFINNKQLQTFCLVFGQSVCFVREYLCVSVYVCDVSCPKQGCMRKFRLSSAAGRLKVADDLRV